MAQEKLIIIGAVAAGTKAAAKVRRECQDIQITLYNDGEHISYSACGLPYFIEGLFEDRNRLIARTPEDFKKQNIDVFVNHRVENILPDEKKVEVLNLKTGERFFDNYTKLLITTGASPFIPAIEGVKGENIFTLRTVEDAVNIKSTLKTAKKAVIIGGGYIGIEMAESFKANGLDVTIIERGSQLLSNFDADIAEAVREYAVEKGLNIILNERVEKITENHVITDKGTEIKRDIVLVSVGVKPNVELAKKIGIELGKSGAIVVDETMKTNLDNIWAAGDCVETKNIITGEKVWIPLGSTANKQGRIAALNIIGKRERHRGVLGSMVTRMFDFSISKTGLGEKEAEKLGFNPACVTISHRDRAGYMPGSSKITIKLIADRQTRKILGAQVIGKGDVDKRINTVAVAILAELTLDEFLEIDLTYAPPFSPAIDGILVAAQKLAEQVSCLRNTEKDSP